MVLHPRNSSHVRSDNDESEDEFEHQPLWGGFTNDKVPDTAKRDPLLPAVRATSPKNDRRGTRHLPDLEGDNNVEDEEEMETESETEAETNNAIAISEKTWTAKPGALSYFRNKMLSHVSKSNAFFRNQQREEGELTCGEKKIIAKEILEKNPATFLARFGQYLKVEHLCVFDQFRGTYEVDFHLKEVERGLCKFNHNVVVKNRRYEAMKKLINEGEYFSDQAMKQRNPHLFEHLVGQFLTVEERSRLEPEGEMCSLSTLLMAHADRDQTSSKRRQKQEREASAWEEEFNSDDEDEELEESQTMQQEITEEERQMFREEFESSMHRSFLEGNDEDFDYNSVDHSTEYDNLELRAQDEEERYFDED